LRRSRTEVTITLRAAQRKVMRTPQAPFAARRVGACRLVLGALLATTMIAATLIAALASFAGQALPQAAGRRLAASPSTSIVISGALNSALVRSDTPAVRKAVKAALGTVPFTMYRSLWSDSLGLPTSYGRTPIPLLHAAAPEGLAEHAALAKGTWPGKPAIRQPVPVAVPAAVAARLKLQVGDVLPVRDRNSGAGAALRVVGIFRPLHPAAPYWGIDVIGAGGTAVAGGFVTYGPVVVDPSALGGGQLTIGGASWVTIPQTGRIGDRGLRPLAREVRRLEPFLENSPRFGGIQVTTSLPGVLEGVASNLVVARSLLVIGALQLLLVAAAAVTLATRLLAGQRATESALLSARGCSRWQLARLDAGEVVPIACVAAAFGALLGSRIAHLMAGAGPLGASGLRVPGMSAAAWWAACAAAAFCVAAALVPAARIATPGVARARRGRQAPMAGVIRAGGDIALVALAAAAVWQLRTYSAVARTSAGLIGIDPVLAAAPALALAGGAVCVMRLLPLMARGADRLASAGRRLLGALAAWEISRRPIRQSGPALIMVLAVATGTLAFAQRESWQRSAHDQAAFATGSDIRVDTPGPVHLAWAGDIAGASGGAGAMPVARITSEPAGIVLALDARKAPATVLLRPDLSPLPASSLWRRLHPATLGVAVPGRPARLEIAASLGPASLRLGRAQVNLSVQDAAGVAYTAGAGTLPADGQVHTLAASISPTRRAAYPLRLLAVRVVYTMPVAKTRDAVFTIRGFAARAATPGGPPPFAAGNALHGWSPAVTSDSLTQAERAQIAAPGVEAPAIAQWSATRSGAQSLSFRPGHGMVPPAPYAPPVPASAEVALTAGTPGAPAIPPIPGVATRAFLGATKAAVGTTVTTVVNGVTIPVRIVASLGAFPTVTGAGGALILDQTALQDVLAAQSADPVPVSEWWMRGKTATAAGKGPLTRLPAGSAVSFRAAAQARLLANPLSALPQQAMLAVAVAAALLAAAGFAVSVAASAAEKRSQDALLAALGLSRGARAGLLCLEELMLSIPSAAAGLLLGAAAARLLIPAITLTSSAAPPLPPAATVLAWPWVAAMAAAVAMVPVLAAAGTVAHRPDPAAGLRAAESG
jgi:FtsX-like permease family